MVINERFLLYICVAIIAYAIALFVKNFIVKIIFGLIAVGAATVAMNETGVPIGWIFLVQAVLFAGVGISSLKFKDDKFNRITGIILVILAIVLVILAVTNLGTVNSAGAVGTVLVTSLAEGVGAFLNAFGQLLTGA